MDVEVVKRALKFTRSTESGVLSTYSQDVPGYPFGSVTPFVLSNENVPIILISDIAQHTKNLKADSKCCLTIFSNQTNAQNNFRITIIGDGEINEDEKIGQKYFNFFPESKNYFKTHNFFFYTIRPKRVRFIAGFGDIHWIETNEWNHSEVNWKDEETGIIDHMNKDHKNVLELMAKKLFEQSTNDVKLISIDPNGAHIKIDKDIYYHGFDKSAFTTEQMREAFVDLAKRLRL